MGNIAQQNKDSMTNKHQIYCFNNGGNPGWLHACAIADDGHCLAQHICSHESYMRHYLGMGDSTWKHEEYNKHFGEGNWELVWIDDVMGDTRLNAAYKLNQKLAEATKETVENVVAEVINSHIS